MKIEIFRNINVTRLIAPHPMGNGQACRFAPAAYCYGLLLLLFCPLALAAQSNGVTVSGLNVAAGMVTFNVRWEKTGMPPLWSDTVWVFVDYNNAGKMERLPLSAGATLTATSAPGVGRVIQYSDNNKGVWVVGNARSNGSFSATVQLLAATATVVGACAYASNYPPVAEYLTAQTVKFTGTPPYDLALNTGAAITWKQAYGEYNLLAGQTLEAFSDKTGAPGIIKCMPMSGGINFKWAPPTISKGQPATFTVNAMPTGPAASEITYNWSAAGFTPDSYTGTSFTAVAPANPNTYKVTLTARSVAYCDLSVTNNVTVANCLTPATFTLLVSASGFCAGDAAGAGFSLSGTEYGRKYQLYRDGTSVGAALSGTGSVATFSESFNVGGLYTARSVQEGADCEVEMTGSHAITSNPLPEAPLISADDVCLNGGDLVFTVTQYSGLLTWISADGGETGGDNNTSVTFSGDVAGTKTVKAQTSQTYTNAPTCFSAEATQSATVNPLPTIAHVSESGSTDQALYAAGTLIPIQYIIPGATTATIDGTLPANLSATWVNDTLTISGFAPNNPGEQQYYAISVSALNQYTGCNTTYTLTGVIHVLPPLPLLSATEYLIEGTIWSDVFTLSPSSCTGGHGKCGQLLFR
ncbi:MAG: hypothetical protein LBD52_00760 [Prevotellaceae bacterium]|jgi:hypothetical protein|nr:hypothetical protein [Prevotellaceae bacterium]